MFWQSSALSLDKSTRDVARGIISQVNFCVPADNFDQIFHSDSGVDDIVYQRGGGGCEKKQQLNSISFFTLLWYTVEGISTRKNPMGGIWTSRSPPCLRPSCLRGMRTVHGFKFIPSAAVAAPHNNDFSYRQISFERRDQELFSPNILSSRNHSRLYSRREIL